MITIFLDSVINSHTVERTDHETKSLMRSRIPIAMIFSNIMVMLPIFRCSVKGHKQGLTKILC